MTHLDALVKENLYKRPGGENGHQVLPEVQPEPQEREEAQSCPLKLHVALTHNHIISHPYNLT